MKKILVYHDLYGCDTGCCGHSVVMDGKREFFFDHPDYKESHIYFAKRLCIEAFGEEHCKDLDWENCLVQDRIDQC